MAPSRSTPGVERGHDTETSLLKVGRGRSHPYKTTSYGALLASSKQPRNTPYIDIANGSSCHQLKPAAFVDLTGIDDDNKMQEVASDTLESSSTTIGRSDISPTHVKHEGDSKPAPSSNRPLRRRDIYNLKDANNPITHSKAYEKTRG